MPLRRAPGSISSPRLDVLAFRSLSLEQDSGSSSVNAILMAANADTLHTNETARKPSESEVVNGQIKILRSRGPVLLTDPN